MLASLSAHLKQLQVTKASFNNQIYHISTASSLKPSTIMHAFSKLMPLGLSALALALPSQLQERAGTQFTDTV